MKRASLLLKAYLFPQWPTVLLLCIFLIVGIALSLINPLILSAFIDAISTGMPLAALTNMAALYLVVAMSKQIISVGETPSPFKQVSLS